MGLANLSGLIFLLSIPALIYIYYFSRRKKRVEISSIIPWRVLRESVVTSSLFHADILFLLQLLLLLFLAAAACRPYWESGAAGPAGRHLVIVLDRSASMSTREGKRSRWEAARARALRLVRSLGGNDRVTLIAAAARPRVIASSESNRARLEEMIKGLDAADTPDRLGPAVELAVSVMSRGPDASRGKGAGGDEGPAPQPAELYIITDRSARSLGIDPGKKPRNVRIVRVGRPAENRAITALSLYTDPFRTEPKKALYATVENFDDDEFIGSLRIRQNGKNIQSRQLRMPPGGAETVMLAEQLPEGRIEVVLDPPDALPADNIDTLLADRPEAVKAVLFTRGPDVAAQFKTLADAVPSLDIDILAPALYASTDMGRYRLAIFHRAEPEDLPETNLLVIQPPEKSRLVEVRDDWVPGAGFVDWDEAHPVGRNLRGLQDVPLSGCREIDTPAWGSAVVVSSTSGGDIPLVVCGERGGRKVAVTTFDTREIEFRKTGSMPGLVLMLNLLGWLSEDETGRIATGEIYETRVPAGHAGAAAKEGAEGAGQSIPLSLEDPRGRRSEVRADGSGRVIVYDTDYAGLYRLRGKGVERVFTANLLSRAESDLMREGDGGDRVELSGAFSREIAGRGPPDRSALFFLIALILFLLEWLVYTAQSRGWLRTGKA